jgi:hypothetical protein
MEPSLSDSTSSVGGLRPYKPLNDDEFITEPSESVATPIMARPEAREAPTP